MPQYEGFIKNVKEDGKAEVVIQPDRAGIVGAPHLDICHCPSDSSRITFQAFNKANAGVGDLVLIRSDSTRLLKNAAKLIGMPLLGLITASIATTVLSQNWILHRTSVFSVVGAGLLAGVIIGVVTYRRTTDAHDPIITHIIKKGSGASTSFCEFGSDFQNGGRSKGRSCNLCSP